MKSSVSNMDALQLFTMSQVCVLSCVIVESRIVRMDNFVRSHNLVTLNISFHEFKVTLCRFTQTREFGIATGVCISNVSGVYRANMFFEHPISFVLNHIC